MGYFNNKNKLIITAAVFLCCALWYSSFKLGTNIDFNQNDYSLYKDVTVSQGFSKEIYAERQTEEETDKKDDGIIRREDIIKNNEAENIDKETEKAKKETDKTNTDVVKANQGSQVKTSTEGNTYSQKETESKPDLTGVDTVVLYGRELPVYTDEELKKMEEKSKDSPPIVFNEEDYYADGVVNINMATKAELMELVGVDSQLADNIIAFRNKKGAFVFKEAFRDVEGMTDEIYKANEDVITVSRIPRPKEGK